jgi:hypothetical protein
MASIGSVLNYKLFRMNLVRFQQLAASRCRSLVAIRYAARTIIYRINNPFIGCDLRCQRAKEHLAEATSLASIYTLQQEGKTYWDINAKLENALVFKSEYTAPPLKISIIIGEIIYNLRSSLDYLVFSLAQLDSGSQQLMTQYPICDNLADFKKRTSRDLQGLSPLSIGQIEKFQPFSGSPCLKTLRELSNPDKHRHLLKAGHSSIHNMKITLLPNKEERIDTSERIFLTFDDDQEVLPTIQLLITEVENIIALFKKSF